METGLSFKRIFINVKDIQTLQGCSYNSAWREMKAIKAAFDKTKKQKITIFEMATWQNVKIEDIKAALQL